MASSIGGTILGVTGGVAAVVGGITALPVVGIGADIL